MELLAKKPAQMDSKEEGKITVENFVLMDLETVPEALKAEETERIALMDSVADLT